MHSYTPVVLSQPLQSKSLYRKGNVMFRVGAATMQGWRYSMEDAHCINLSLPQHPEAGFFAVYDGHGGTATSCYLSEHFHLDIDNLPNIHNKTGIIRTAIEFDKKVMTERNTFRDGSTAVFAIVDKHKGQYLVTLGNVGDSRAVLIKGGKKGIALTKDHLPNNKREKLRILRAGGVVRDGRVRGELAVSRSFGDSALKLPTTFPPEDKMVIPIPDIKVLTVNPDDLLLLTCDGIYEKDQVFTVETVTKFIAEDLRYTDDLAATCARLLDATLQRRSYDNMSAILIQFKEGTDYHQDKLDYIPGPYYEGARHTNFKRAYALDAKQAGFTMKQAKMMYEARMGGHKLSFKDRARNLNRKNSGDVNNPLRVQRRNSESEALLSSKEKLVVHAYDADEGNNPLQIKPSLSRRKSESISASTKERSGKDIRELPTPPLSDSEDEKEMIPRLKSSGDIRSDHKEKLHRKRVKSTESLVLKEADSHVIKPPLGDSGTLTKDRSERRRKSPSPVPVKSKGQQRRRKTDFIHDTTIENEDDIHYKSSDNEVHHSELSSDEHSPISRDRLAMDLSKLTEEQAALSKSAPRNSHHHHKGARTTRRKREHRSPHRDHVSSPRDHVSSPRDEELRRISSDTDRLSDEEAPRRHRSSSVDEERRKGAVKKHTSKTRKNRKIDNHDELSKDDSEDEKVITDQEHALIEAVKIIDIHSPECHTKKHNPTIFSHIPILQRSFWHLKRNTSHKKEIRLSEETTTSPMSPTPDSDVDILERPLGPISPTSPKKARSETLESLIASHNHSSLARSRNSTCRTAGPSIIPEHYFPDVYINK